MPPGMKLKLSLSKNWHIEVYHKSGNFSDDLIFTYSAITFESQTIECTEVCNIFYKEHLLSQKMTQIKKFNATHFSLFCKFCDTVYWLINT